MQKTVHILQTKLHMPPPRGENIRRSALFDLLDSGLDYTLILLSAPAGYGKTTLAAHWLKRQQHLSVAWLSLDADDNDPTRFFQHLTAALSPIIPETSLTLQEMLTSPQPPNETTLVAGLLNGLAQVEDHILIALDDYHTIEQRRIHEAVQQFLERASANVHVLMTTRADPSFALSRLRARNRLLEIRAKDLRFEADETARFFQMTSDIHLPAAQLSQIMTKTEGWVAALQLVALSLRGLKDVTAFVDNLSGAQRYIVDYLVDEVLSNQPEDIQHFLLQTSVLQRMCAELCEALTGRDNSQQILEDLERDNLFLIPLDDERRWYRYHHLFAQFLQNRLGKQASKQQNQRAAVWFRQAGFLEEAAHYAFAGDDLEAAGMLLEEVFRPALARGMVVSLANSYKLLPEALFEKHPDWQISYAVTLFSSGYVEEAEVHLERAVANLPQVVEDKRRVWVGWVAALRALIAAWRLQADDTLAWAAQALELVPEDDFFTRAAIHYAQGTVLYRVKDRIDAALEAFDKSITYGLKARHFALIADAAQHIGLMYNVIGNLSESEANYRRVLALLAEAKPLEVALTAIYDGLALTLQAQGRLEEALTVYPPDFLNTVAQSGILPIQGGTWLTQASLLASVNRMEEAFALNRMAYPVVRQIDDPLMIRLIDSQYATFCLWTGNLSAVEQWQAQYESAVPYEARLIEPERYFETILWMKILLWQQDYRLVLDSLPPMKEIALASGRYGQRLELLIVQALALYGLGERETAFICLQEAIDGAIPQGYVQLFVDYRDFMRDLLGAYVKKGNVSIKRMHFIEHILALLEAATPRPGTLRIQTNVATSSNAALSEPLTSRELEILSLAAGGLTNQEIADRLVISVATVKKHISNIFLKMDVQNRTQAIHRAREYGLLA